MPDVKDPRSIAPESRPGARNPLVVYHGIFRRDEPAPGAPTRPIRRLWAVKAPKLARRPPASALSYCLAIAQPANRLYPIERRIW